MDMLIFLDIDGVMVPAKGWKIPEVLADGFPAFSSKATYMLQNLMTDDITVILTTSHKSNYTIEEWKSIFMSRGIVIDRLQCLPGNTNNLTRRAEIMNWFSINSINEDFLILDDDKSLNELPQHLKEHLIQPISYVGLTDEHLEMARSIIAKQ